VTYNVQQIVQRRSQSFVLPDYLTNRKGIWQFVRRVPLDFAHLDPRQDVKHTTKVPVAKDRRGIKAGKIADTMNRELEAYWRGLSGGKAQEARERYAEARRRARTFGFDYAETAELASRSTVEVLERLEKLPTAAVVEDPTARAAVLRYEKRPTVKLSEVFSKDENQTRNEVKDMSPKRRKKDNKPVTNKQNAVHRAHPCEKSRGTG